jgi:hypothetical protein
LNEEALALTRKIKKAQSTLMSLKEELKDIGHENQREMEGLLENIRQLNKELSYFEAIEKLYIPDDHRVSTSTPIPIEVSIFPLSNFLSFFYLSGTY